MSVLRLENVSLAVGAFSLRDISLTVASGEYFVLRGPNGAGKSLLMKTVCGLVPVQSGRIHIGEEEVTHLPPRARHVGYIPQGSDLFPHLSVRRNITFPLEVAGVEADEIRTRLEGIVSLLNLGELLSRSVVRLSGGERQRVALARALAARPRLLIMDEPLSEIDEEARDEVCRGLRSIQREIGVTTVHISHSSRETELVADRTGILSDGILRATPATKS